MDSPEHDDKWDASDYGLAGAATIIFSGFVLQNIYGAPASGSWGRLDVAGLVAGFLFMGIVCAVDHLRRR